VCASAPAAPAARALNTTELRDAVTLAGVRAHQAQFQAFANQSDGTREASTLGYKLSADYVASSMEAAGYRVSRQSFEYNFYEELAAPIVIGTSDGFPFSYTDGVNISTMDGAALVTYIETEAAANRQVTMTVTTSTESDTISTGSTGSGVVEDVFVDFFDSIGRQTEPTAFDGRSDYDAFVAAGIPAGPGGLLPALRCLRQKNSGPSGAAPLASRSTRAITRPATPLPIPGLLFLWSRWAR
jgi:hypothetical protein